MRTLTEQMNGQVITTTLGDLIFAISEVARESANSEQEVSCVTQLVLQDLLRLRKD